MNGLLDPINLAALGFAAILLVACSCSAAHLLSPIFFPSRIAAIRGFSISAWMAHYGFLSPGPLCGWLLLVACFHHCIPRPAIGSFRMARLYAQSNSQFYRVAGFGLIPSAILFSACQIRCHWTVIRFGAEYGPAACECPRVPSVSPQLADRSHVLAQTA